MRYEIELHPYQDDAIEFVHENPFSALWIDMGLGKTATILTVIRDLLRDKKINRCLVVAPLKVATQTWPHEIAAWHHLRDIKYALIRSTDQAVRVQLAQSKAPLHIINREMLVWLVNLWAEARRWPYDMVVVDESSSLKDHTTKRFKAMKLVRPLLKRFHELTATPAAESYMGLFTQAYLLDQGERFGKSVGAFRRRYFTIDGNPNAKHPTYKVTEAGKREIAEKLSDITLVMREEDYLSNPQPRMLTRPLSLEPAELKAYKKFERTLVLTLPDGREIEALTAAALSQKLLQAASGAVYDEHKTPILFHNHKIEDLEEVVEELDGSPVMVTYWFKSSLARLKAAFPQATVMDRTGKAVTPWNNGEIPILLVHPQSAGHGLNMQYGPGHDVYMFDMFWSHELWDQVIRRVARQGQKKRVRVHVPIIQGTHDEDALESQQTKGDSQADLKKSVLRLRSRVRG